MSLLPLKCNQHLVYSLPADWAPRPLAETDAETVWADRDTVNTLFRHDHKRRVQFLGFLKQGGQGVFHRVADEWVNYAWTTMPDRPRPYYIPLALRKNAYWIFHCGTREAFRGRGLYQRSLILLAHWARQNTPAAKVFVETVSGNIPSQRGILSAGFRPHGVAKAWTLTMPKIKSWTRATWQVDQPHPAMGHCT